MGESPGELVIGISPEGDVGYTINTGEREYQEHSLLLSTVLNWNQTEVASIDQHQATLDEECLNQPVRRVTHIPNAWHHRSMA